ncbi:hypothetical protein LCGC14_0372370 [marine sediment metagenome]|uniref:Phosphoadenosine phosphosulphate reductase domain-containing protein n=1 Tax=marine sediment metagenome TaxID=412755 RepID=A0A0F9VRU1_9ZZZZ
MSLRIFPEKRLIPEKKPKTFVLFPYELHAKMRGTFEEKEEESIRLIKGHLEHYTKCYVASSHGKDSIVLVHLIWRVCKELDIPMIDVWLNHTLNVYKEEKAYWDAFNKWLDIENCFRIFYPPEDENGHMYTVWSVAKKVGHLPNFRRTARKVTGSYKESNIPECCKILKKDSINAFLKSLPKDQRYDCHFIGTRAQESQIRSLGVLQRCRSYLIKSRRPYPMQAVTPLSFWKAVDVLEYFHRYIIPQNPTYSVHNIDRMGCASCPAHKNWETRLARDPTEEGFGMLKQNLKILAKTDVPRLKNSIKTLDNYIFTTNEITQSQKNRLTMMLQEIDGRILLTDYTS